MSTNVEVAAVPPAPGRRIARETHPIRYAGGVLLLAACYYGAAKIGQTLRYTASVSAIWPPAGVGIAALCLWGFRWWPGILLGELVINAELISGDSGIPIASVAGQQIGNMAEVIVGALLLRRLLGARTPFDRVEQVGQMLIALGIATTISATVGTVAMIAGDVIGHAEAITFWRTWWLGDTSGALVVVPLALAWARDSAAAWRPVRSWSGAATIAAVIVLTAVAVSTSAPLSYLIFPALMFAALRLGVG